MTTVVYRPGYVIPALDEARWATRTLAQAVLVALAWPVRLAWLVLRHVHWGTGETVFCTVLAAGPVGMLIRLYPSVRWPTAEQALSDLQHVVMVLAVTWLALYLRAGAGGGRSCCAARSCGAHRSLVPSPDGTKTWRWIVAVHEAGHLVVGKKLGRRTGVAKIYGRGGLTQVWPDHKDIVGEVAIDMAGGFAAGTQAGCEGDRANARWRLQKYVESHRRGGVMSAGTSKARSMVATHHAEIIRTAQRIYTHGSTR